MKRDSEGAHDRQAKRFQVPRACDRCKSLRRGCSENRPCRRCVKAGLGDECVASSSAVLSPGNLPFAEWEEALRRIRDFVEDEELVKRCIDRFFDLLHPTIPVVSRQYVDHLLSEAGSPTGGLEARCLLAALSAQVILQTDDVDGVFHDNILPDKNGPFARTLFCSALLGYHSLPRLTMPGLGQCLLVFFLYTCHIRLSQHAQAFLFLREATTQLMVLKLRDEDAPWKSLMSNLFWVLLVSERSHAIRYSRPITLQITSETPLLDDLGAELEPFRALAHLFEPIDSHLVAALNKEQLGTPPSHLHLNRVEATINNAIQSTTNVKPGQTADLHITQLWLRIVLWKLRLRLGYLSNHPDQPSVTFRYPVIVANDLVDITRQLPLDSIQMHGGGITEKVFDIASTLVDVLAGVPSPLPTMIYTPGGSSIRSRENLRFLRSLILQLPDGPTIYDDLIQTHISQTMPGLLE
ncbi:hypothetical protein VHEMI07149 [[Torrubiella] hemipterigena]|uniref:Zn(2)-C6 fungal-type domain-containing protein n=1 Tax=[Torrubiella] hemipterigena TaxID=1531966 RepID=A0A0A1T9F2_9HYPO|nr:hypothetical protein VHEMI07149 [[Torrubiella] hemipterigena]